MPKYKVKFHETCFYELTVEAENAGRAFDEATGCAYPEPYLKQQYLDLVTGEDEVQEVLDSLTSEQYEVISAELDRLNARIKELEAK